MQSADPAPTHGLWADLLGPGVPPEQADFTVIGVPYDDAACARRGAALGPERIRFWSQHLAPYTEDRTRLWGIRVADLGDVPLPDGAGSFESVLAALKRVGGIPIVLGGDHSISIPVLQAQRQRYAGRRLGILWLDAHPDLCDVFTGSRYSHACVLRRGLEFGIEPEDVCLVGLRSWEEQEVELIEHGGLHVYTAAQVASQGMNSVARDVRDVLSRCDAVHVSLDIDCLDPAFAPGTGIPEAAGLSTREVVTLIHDIEGLPLAGLDLVEVAPPLDASEATVFAALRLIIEFIGTCRRTSQHTQE